MTDLKWVQAHLLKLSKGEIKPHNDKVGICHELYHQFQGIFDIDCRGWEYFSGYDTYPVPLSKGWVNTSVEAPIVNPFHTRVNLWDDSGYGNLRRELCGYLAETEGAVTHGRNIRVRPWR